MDSLAKKLDHEDVFQETGTVVRVDDRIFVVRTEGGEHRLKRAASCLLEPELYDYVLVARVAVPKGPQAAASPGQRRAPSGAGYILAVLEREEGARAAIVLDGDLAIRLPRGRFDVAAQEGVALASGQTLSVAASAVEINAEEGSVVVQRLTYLGAQVLAEVAKVKVLAGTFDSVLDRLTQRVKRSYRFVEELDHVKAERIDYTAEKTVNLHGENTMVTAEVLVKLDAEQIHIG